MDAIQRREERFAIVNRALMCVYIAFAATLGVVNVVKGLPYYYLLSFGSILIFPAVNGAYRLLRMKRCHQLDFIIFLYTFLAFPLGVAGTFYHVVPYYDKIMHTLSGCLTVALALPIYYKLKGKHGIVRRADRAQAIAFCLLAAIAVAGLWETGEYILSLLTGMDNQRVLTTGIHDTMQDMIVCTLGALLTVPSMIGYYRDGRMTLLTGAFHAFARGNLPGNEIAA